ncbi:MAG TPA: T9SS type A sorting domain-containing protein [Bacteroidia bacterium]|nr:T9SS type A sorting domain-containing protein [Bacteroidia bacterium]
MKKILSLFAGVVLSVSAFAQLTPGSTAPNWTYQDLNGNTWDLYTLTAQGKTVFIDVSATWCGPCWNYHNTHALRDIYNEYGPTGTIVPGEIMVFFIEGDAATTLADLNGTGSNTQGNWVSGTTYPIIDPGSATNTFNSNYAIGYFPTVYKVCPDNKIYEVGQASPQALLNSINSCTFATDAFPSAGPSALQCATMFSPTFDLKNNGTTTMTSCTVTYTYDGGTPATYNWSGSLATGASTTVTLPSASFTAATHTMEVITSNPNGGNDNNNTNNLQEYTFTINTAAATSAPLVNNISATGFPYASWLVNDADNAYPWTRVTANGGSLKKDCYTDGNVGSIDDFIVEPVDMTSLTSATLTFDVANRRYSAAYTESLEVLVSADCGVTWTSVWMKSGATLSTVTGYQTTAFTPTTAQWRAESADLSAFAGDTKVFVMFRATNGYGNNMYVDNINISGVTGIADQVSDNTNISLFPNPANSTANLSFELGSKSEVTVNVYNTLGELVFSENKGELAPGKQLVAISTENLSNGMYMVELVAGDNTSVTRMNVSH